MTSPRQRVSTFNPFDLHICSLCLQICLKLGVAFLIFLVNVSGAHIELWLRYSSS